MEQQQQGEDRICSKIDRVLANQAWLDSFPATEARRTQKGVLSITNMEGVRVENLDQGADALLAEYTIDEVEKAIFDIPGNKSPRPDGYGSFFFQDNWEIIGKGR
uniref:Uncharacterized protein n=1 Tax=Cannabis sativa TaxID=3483 RepID=A0A803PKL8_CANSA